jgi:hypothetical protein
VEEGEAWCDAVTKAGFSKHREGRFKAKCVKWARDRKIPVAKLTDCIGIPDAIFFVPGGVPVVPEFKDPNGGGAPSPAQTWYLERLRELGYDVALVASWEGFLEMMRSAGVE